MSQQVKVKGVALQSSCRAHFFKRSVDAQIWVMMSEILAACVFLKNYRGVVGP
jgi:hypothetical protein